MRNRSTLVAVLLTCVILSACDEPGRPRRGQPNRRAEPTCSAGFDVENASPSSGSYDCVRDLGESLSPTRLPSCAPGRRTRGYDRDRPQDGYSCR
jgi:hypothetical protein